MKHPTKVDTPILWNFDTDTVWCVDTLISIPFGDMRALVIAETQEGVRMSLDCAQACLITSNTLVISVKGGELWVPPSVTRVARQSSRYHSEWLPSRRQPCCRVSSVDAPFLPISERHKLVVGTHEEASCVVVTWWRWWLTACEPCAASTSTRPLPVYSPPV